MCVPMTQAEWDAYSRTVETERRSRELDAILEEAFESWPELPAVDDKPPTETPPRTSPTPEIQPGARDTTKQVAPPGSERGPLTKGRVVSRVPA